MGVPGRGNDAAISRPVPKDMLIGGSVGMWPPPTRWRRTRPAVWSAWPAGDAWTELWLCLSCGWVACSDDSPSRHAFAHYAGDGPPDRRRVGARIEAAGGVMSINGRCDAGDVWASRLSPVHDDRGRR